MSEEKDFFKTCFNTVASLDVKNESQAIAKEVVLSEVERLQQENKQLKEKLDYDLQWAFKYDKQVGNWNKLKEYFNERIEVCDNRLSTPFCNFEKVTKERLIFSQCLEKLEELEKGSDNQ